MPAGPRVYTGALHVHTDQSCGSGTLAEVVEAARRNGIDFVVLADSGRPADSHENVEGWHDGVLILCAQEVRCGDGHLMAFETREAVQPAASLREAAEAVRRQYGTPVAIHHQLTRAGEPRRSTLKLAALDMSDAAIVEIWSFVDEFLARTNGKYVMQAATRPEKLLHGPSRRLFWQWDRELERRMLPVIGGLNVHQRKNPLLDWRVFFPYDVAFQTVCTCVMTTELPSVWLRARDLVWNALREGRSYVVNRSVGSEKGFGFEFVTNGGRTRHMGDEVTYTPSGRFQITLPEEAEAVLRHNGQPLFWGTTKKTSFPPAGPGSYRVEVYLNRRLWVISNPIRLTDEDGIMQPTVSDVT